MAVASNDTGDAPTAPEIEAGRFVHELPLVVDFAAERELRLRFEVGRKLYNALLGEAVRRIRRVRHDLRAHEPARLAAKSAADAQIIAEGLHYRRDAAAIKAIRKTAYANYNETRKALYREHGCSRYGLGYYATALSRSTPLFAPGHALGATVVQMLSARAWRAAEKYLLDPRVRVRFVRPTPGISSVESMNDRDAIRVVGDRVLWSGGRGGGTVTMRLRMDRKGRDLVEHYARSCSIVQTRILRRDISGRTRWFAQLVLAGAPALRPWLTTKAATVGLDLGLSICAYDSADESGLIALSGIPEQQRVALALKQRRTMRALDRSRRATNAGNYDAKGRIVPRAQRTRWATSNAYTDTLAGYHELSRVATERRKYGTRALVNSLARVGNCAVIENLSMRAWQREYGRATGFAPGEFTALLDRRLTALGGALVKIPAHVAQLSRLCHECGQHAPHTFARSVLARRQPCPTCGDHNGVQADLYQSFLARFTDAGGIVDLSQAQAAWAGASTRLAAAGSTIINATKNAPGRSRPYREALRRALRTEESVAAESRLGATQEPASSRRRNRVDTASVEVPIFRAPLWGTLHAEPLERPKKQGRKPKNCANQRSAHRALTIVQSTRSKRA